MGFRAAGADGIFAPGAVHPGTVKELADGIEGIDRPLKVLVGPGALPVAEPAAPGVARASAGSGLAQAAYAVVRRAARELLDVGTDDAQRGGLDYGERAQLAAGARASAQEASRISSARSWSRSSWRCSRPAGTSSLVAARKRRTSAEWTCTTAVPWGAWNSRTVRSKP